MSAPILHADPLNAPGDTNDDTLMNAPSGGEYQGMPTFEGADFQAKPHGLPDSTADHPLTPTQVGEPAPLIFDAKS
jgi:hypothetical protein